LRITIVQINVKNRQSVYSLPTLLVKRVVKSVIEFEGQDCDEVSIFFVSTLAISKLHKQFFDDPTPTDCISFPIDISESFGYRVLGDVFVCPETAVKYVEEHGGNIEREMILYIVHGLLHLMGYDDIDVKDRKAMRLAEKRHLKYLGI
jgi:probable rRNA maturation factor